MLPKLAYRLLLIAAIVVHFVFAYWVDRSNSALVLSSFALLWLIFLIQWADQKLSVKQMVLLGMTFRAVYLLAVPELSDDVFRYIWDGHMIVSGHSPYSFTPHEYLDVAKMMRFQHFEPLLNSPDYYSIYPPVLQFVFWVSAKVGGDSLLTSIILLRGFVLLGEFGSVVLIWKLLKAWGLKERNLMLYALNPLVIVEFAGNLHGEVFMIFFLLLSLWFLARSASPNPSLPGGEWRPAPTIDQRASSPSDKGEYPKGEVVMLSAVSFGLSVGSKLLPLMFLPFYVKRLGWKNTLRFSLVAAATAAVLYLPFYSDQLISNTLSSLRLYFINFEFNGSVYYVLREIGILFSGYNQIAIIGRSLSLMVLAIILLIAWRNKNTEVSGLPTLMLFAWFVYYALATTVNPWYVAVLAAFLPFTKYRFALLWLITVPLSYHAFGQAEYGENAWVLTLEYVPVYLWLMFELGWLGPLKRFWALKRAEVKQERLLPLLCEVRDPSLHLGRQREALQILEVGAGNGALMKLLGEEGMKMTALDISDKSLFEDVKVDVYDGKKFPFGDKQFDVCQLITMLHHTRNAEELIGEAKRISGRIIIMEDIFENPFQKYLTWLTDSLVNWEFYGHPHTNLSDAEWREMFARKGLLLEKAEYYRFLFFFKQVSYVLKAT